jgi:hypothetical protein
MGIWSILQPFDLHISSPFGIFCGNVVYFSLFLVFCTKKIWQSLRVGFTDSLYPPITALELLIKRSEEPI